MTEYEFTKRPESYTISPYTIRLETEDYEFLEFMDQEIDKLIKDFYDGKR